MDFTLLSGHMLTSYIHGRCDADGACAELPVPRSCRGAQYSISARQPGTMIDIGARDRRAITRDTIKSYLRSKVLEQMIISIIGDARKVVDRHCKILAVKGAYIQ